MSTLKVHSPRERNSGLARLSRLQDSKLLYSLTNDLGDPPEYEPPPERSLGHLAQQTARNVESVAYDILLSKGVKGKTKRFLLTPK